MIMSPPEPLTKNEDTRSFPPIFLTFTGINKSLKTPLKFGAKNQVSLDLSGKDFKLMDKINFEISISWSHFLLWKIIPSTNRETSKNTYGL